MKLNTIAAVALSLTSLVATAQTLDLNFSGTTFNGSFAQQAAWFGGWNGGVTPGPTIGGTQIFDGTVGSNLATGTTTFSSLPPGSSASLGSLFGSHSITSGDTDYAFLFFKVSRSTSNTALSSAGLLAKLEITDVPGVRDFSFLNGTNSLILDPLNATDLQYWRGFSVATSATAPTGNGYDGQAAAFANLIPGGLFSNGLGGFTTTTSNITPLGPDFFATQAPGGSTVQEDVIFATVIQASRL